MKILSEYIFQKTEETVQSNYFKHSDDELPSISGTYFEKDEAKITEITETNDNDVKPTQITNAEEADNRSVGMEVTEENMPSVQVIYSQTEIKHCQYMLRVGNNKEANFKNCRLKKREITGIQYQDFCSVMAHMAYLILWMSQLVQLD